MSRVFVRLPVVMSPWFPSLIVIGLFLALKLEISWITPWSVRIRRWETCVYFHDRKRHWNEFLMKRFYKTLTGNSNHGNHENIVMFRWANTAIYRYFSVFKRRKERYLLKTCFYTRLSKPVSVNEKYAVIFPLKTVLPSLPKVNLRKCANNFQFLLHCAFGFFPAQKAKYVVTSDPLENP